MSKSRDPHLGGEKGKIEREKEEEDTLERIQKEEKENRRQNKEDGKVSGEGCY